MGSTLTSLVGDCEERLRRLGVPAFAHSGPTWNHGRIMPLLWMLAFELGVGTSVSQDIPMRALLAAAPFVALLAFVARPISASALGLEAKRYRWYLPLLLTGPVIAFCVLRDTILPLRVTDPVWFWPHPWSDAAVILVSLYAAAILLLQSSRPVSRAGEVLVWTVFPLVAVAQVVFTASFPMPPRIGEVHLHTSLVPLLAATLLLVVALSVARLGASPGSGRPRYVPSSLAAVVVLVYGLSQGLLVYFHHDARFIVATAAVNIGAILWAVVRRALAARATNAGEHFGSAAVDKVKRQIDDPSLRYWIPFFVFAYPVLSFLLQPRATSRMWGLEFNALTELGALMVFNIAYVGFVWFLVGFGMDQVTIWAAAEAWKKRGETMKRMAGTTPLLLIVVMFFAFTAETWQIAAGMSFLRLTVLLALLLGLVVVLVTGWSAVLISRKLRFTNWQEVSDVLGKLYGDREFGDLPERLSAVLRSHPCRRPAGRRLRVMAGLNALLVLLVYQWFTLGAVALSLFLIFLALVLLAVSSDVAAEWIFGDGSAAARKSELVKLPSDEWWRILAMDEAVWASPWLRVSLLLALFSLLHFVAQSLSDEEKRDQYFRGIDVAMRRRIAIHLCYRHLHHAREFEDAQPR